MIIVRALLCLIGLLAFHSLKAIEPTHHVLHVLAGQELIYLVVDGPSYLFHPAEICLQIL